MPISHASGWRRRMKSMVTVLMLAMLALSSLPSPALAIIVGGGGSAKLDCLAVFEADANTPPARPRFIRCVDGDPCDADGQTNGECVFPVALCANSSFDPRCDLRGVQSITVLHSADNGDPRFDPEFQALQTRVDSQLDLPTSDADRCTSPTNFHVKLRGPLAASRCVRNSKLLQTETFSSQASGRRVTESDKLKLICLPREEICLPRTLFAGTFDRIQRQIFNQRCALSACHDSQSRAGNLLLETGASHGNLIDVDPLNTAARGLGWKRITLLAPDSGDPESSFLFHKVSGDLGVGLGSRMPLGRPVLESNLIEIIRLWILAGAPTMGWVPGTDM